MASVNAGDRAAAKRKLVQSTLPMLLAFLDGGTRHAKKRPKTCVAAAKKEQVLLQYALTIYGYRRRVGDAWPYVYVGQTRCHLDVRDEQHLTGDKTHFERAYSLCPGDFRAPEVLEQTTMSREVATDTYRDQAALLADCQKWMDEREAYYIKEHGTYRSLTGLNMTSGGQKGMTKAYFEAQLKKTDSKWQVDNMPAFRTSPYGQKNRLWDIPRDFEQGEVKNLGKLLNSMRTGNTQIPPRFLTELNALGYNDGKSFQDSKWEIDYMPAFRASPYGQKKRLWEMPQDFKQGEEKLGVLLSHMRTGNTSIPPRFLAELNSLGYNDGKTKQDCKWEIDYMPALRASSYGQQGRLWDIPFDFKQGEVKLGQLLDGMRTWNNPIPPRFLAELNALGYNDGKSFQDCKWEIDYMPAFRASSYGQQGRLWEIPFDFKQGEEKLGRLLNGMRTGNTPIPPRFLEELNALGYNDGTNQYESKWQVDYMPAFRASSYGQQGRLWDIPFDFKQGEVKLGKLLNSMRTGKTSIPPGFLAELNALGYNDGTNHYESRWQVDYVPAFRQWRKTNPNRAICKIPLKYKVGNVNNVGSLVYRMRTGGSKVPEQYLQELKDMGLSEKKKKKNRA